MQTSKKKNKQLKKAMLPIELRNYYAILEIPHCASLEEARVSHKRLARNWHPDRLPENERTETSPKALRCQERIREINRALTEIESYIQSPRAYLRALKIQNDARKQGQALRAKWDHQHGRSKTARFNRRVLLITESTLRPLDHLAEFLLWGWSSSRYFLSYAVAVFALSFTVCAIGSPSLKFAMSDPNPNVHLQIAPTKAQIQVNKVMGAVAGLERRVDRFMKTARAEISLPDFPIAKVSKREMLPQGYRIISNRHPTKQNDRPKLVARYS